jgi:hypothetical protein
LTTVLRFQLPAGAKPGDVIAVPASRGGGSGTVAVVVPSGAKAGDFLTVAVAGRALATALPRDRGRDGGDDDGPGSGSPPPSEILPPPPAGGSVREKRPPDAPNPGRSLNATSLVAGGESGALTAAASSAAAVARRKRLWARVWPWPTASGDDAEAEELQQADLQTAGEPTHMLVK